MSVLPLYNSTRVCVEIKLVIGVPELQSVHVVHLVFRPPTKAGIRSKKHRASVFSTIACGSFGTSTADASCTLLTYSDPATIENIVALGGYAGEMHMMPEQNFSQDAQDAEAAFSFNIGKARGVITDPPLAT